MDATLFKDEAEMNEPKMGVTALAPWYGSNRMLAPMVGKELHGCKWVGVPFAGGMSELVYVPKGATILVSDLHKHIINLARVAAHPQFGPKLYRRLRRNLLHAEEHADSQRQAKADPIGDCDIDAAEAYFVAVWMGRSARAGEASELTGGPCVRWTGNGGSSATRYRSATKSLLAWRRILSRCDIIVLDVFKFLERVDDRPAHGLYVDPPFPGPGDKYKHRFTEADHIKLAARLAEFKNCRVVCRFYDHPLIQKLYPQGRWTWNRLKGRTQANEAANEVLIINGPSFT